MATPQPLQVVDTTVNGSPTINNRPVEPVPKMVLPKKSIVIIGGGYSGITIAHHFLKNILPELPADDQKNYNVQLVEPSYRWVNRVAAPRSLVSEESLSLDSWMLDMEEGFAKYSDSQIMIYHGKAISLDTILRRVQVRAATGEEINLPYYALVIATGSSSATPLYGSPHDYVVTRDAITSFRERLSALGTGATIVIAGGGPSAVETAGELAFAMNGYPRWPASQLTTVKLNIILVTRALRLLPTLRPALGLKAEKRLKNMGVSVLYGTTVVETVPEFAGRLNGYGESTMVTASARIMTKDGSGEKVIDADLYIPAYGLTPNTSWIPAELLDETSRVITTTSLRVPQVGHRVYALGDAAGYGYGGLLETKMNALPVLLVNMKRDLLYHSNSSNELSALPGKDKVFVKKAKIPESQLVPIGKGWGVGAFNGIKFFGWMVGLIKGRTYFTENNPKILRGSDAVNVKWDYPNVD